jgi:anaerobic magnesium-protoporphyrin IX monomethyl ester cyclase
MRVSLIQPNAFQVVGPFVPYSLLFIASVLKKNGHKVKILDEQLGKINPADVADSDIIGITCMGGEHVLRGIDIVKSIREAAITIPVVWGGAQPSMTPELALKDSHVDYIIHGYGEKAILELLDSIENKNDVGVNDTFKSHWVDMHPDIFPLPYELLQVDRYPNIPIQTSRGCTGTCNFCYLSNYEYRPISVLPIEVVIKEIEYLQRNFNVKEIWVYDDNFFWNKKRLLTFCEGLLMNKINIKWAASARCNEVLQYNDNEFDLVKRSGCIRIDFGGESGSNDLLRSMNKNLNASETISAATLCSHHDIQCFFNFVLGYPGETCEDLDATVQLLKKLDDIKDTKGNSTVAKYMRFSVFTPWPGTPVYEKAISLNFQPPESFVDWGKYRYCDIAQLGIFSKEIEQYMQSIFYIDYFLHFFPNIPEINHEDRTLAAWENFLRSYAAMFENKARKDWDTLNFSDGWEWSYFETKIRKELSGNIGLPFPT